MAELEQVLVKHAETGATTLVARSSLRILAASGWSEVPKAEAARAEKARRADKAAAAAAMAPSPDDDGSAVKAAPAETPGEGASTSKKES